MFGVEVRHDGVHDVHVQQQRVVCLGLCARVGDGGQGGLGGSVHNGNVDKGDDNDNCNDNRDDNCDGSGDNNGAVPRRQHAAPWRAA